MTVTILGQTSSQNDSWVVDYHDSAEAIQPQTLGVTATGTVADLWLSVKILSTGKNYTLDLTQYLNKGRIVLAGPGSVLNQNAPVPASAVPPPPPKGSQGSYEFQDATVETVATRQIPTTPMTTSPVTPLFYQQMSIMIEIVKFMLTKPDLNADVAIGLQKVLDDLYGTVLTAIFSSLPSA